MSKQVGQTKAVGFQFGIRKTFSVASEKVWDFLFSEEGIQLWLGETEDELELKKDFVTKSGIAGKVRVIKPYSHIRLNWKQKDWHNMSTVQIRVIGNKEKSTVAIHQEKLLNADQRVEMKMYWNEVMDKLGAALGNLSL
ncbi:MAG: SRPBCC domain-containing protein [Crocinitomicaceae bacterium]|nr:SRPBCC domain-containing protein [Crocinitomicaceae bacterium]